MPTYEQNQTEDRYAASAWGSANIDLQMPSGQLALVRKPGVEQLIAAGIINDLDSLSAIAAGLVSKAEGRPQAAQDVVADSTKLASIIHLVDRVICHTVVKPVVHMTPNDQTRRDPQKIYTDMIDLDDKFFIFSYVTGGSTSVADFRAQSQELVGSVDVVEETEMQA